MLKKILSVILLSGICFIPLAAEDYPWGKVRDEQIEDVFLRNDEAEVLEAATASLVIRASEPVDPSQSILELKTADGIVLSASADGDLTLIGDLDVGGSIGVGSSADDDDDSVYFDDGLTESLSWDDDPGEFDLSDDLQVEGAITATGHLNVSDGITCDDEITATGSGSFGGHLDLGNASASDDDYIYFDDGLSEFLMWDDNPGRFVLSDDLSIGLDLSIGSESGADDDILFFDQDTQNITWDESEGLFSTSATFAPFTDNSFSSGTLGRRWSVVYAYDGYFQDDVNCIDQLTVGGIVSLSADKKTTMPQDSSGSGPLRFSGTYIYPTRWSFDVASLEENSGNSWWYKDGKNGTSNIYFDCAVPVELEGGTVVLDSILLHYETTHNNIYIDSSYVFHSDRSTGWTTVSSIVTDSGNGSTGDGSRELLSSDLSRGTYPNRLTIKLEVTDTCGTGYYARFFDFEIRGHYE